MAIAHSLPTIFKKLCSILVLGTASLAFLPAAAEPVRLAAGQNVTSAVFYVAQEMGYFSEEKLQVQLTSCIGAFQCMKDMLDGKVDVSVAGDLAVMFNSLERKDFLVLATYATSTSIMKILARKDARIKGPRDLAGKRIGFVSKTAPHYFLHLYLLTGGVDPRQVKQVALEPNDMAAALASGKVDVIFSYEPLASRQRSELGDIAADLPVPPIYSLGVHIVATRNYITTHEADLVRLLRALSRAEKFIHKNPTYAMQIWTRHAKAGMTDAEAAWKATTFKLSLDSSLVTSLRSAARWAVSAGLADGKSVPEYNSMIYTKPLQKAKPDEVLK